MKIFTAAVAALVVVGSVFAATPAMASNASGSLPAVSGATNVSAVSTDALPFAADALPTLDPAHPAAPPAPATAALPAAARQASTDQSQVSRANGSVTISGTVTVGANAPGKPVAGVIVTATQVDSNDKTIANTDVLSTGTGAFSITGLPDGLYYVSFFYDGDPAGATSMWWGATATNPFGNKAVSLTGSQTLTVTQLLQPTGTLGGRVSTGDRQTAPATSDIDLFLAVRLDSDNKYHPVLQLGWDTAGQYSAAFVLPYSDYAVFAINDANPSYEAVSSSDSFSIGANQSIRRDTIVTRLIAAVGGVSNGTNAFVNALYWDFLSRSPAQADIVFWNRQFAGGAGLGAVSTGFVTSDEYRLIRIDAAYSKILGRGPDAGGRADWLRWMQQGLITTDDIETSFYASQEYFDKQGGSNASFVQAIYTTLLHRDASSADVSFWSRLIAQNGRAWVIAQFWDSTETISERVSLMYASYLGRTPDPAGLANWVGTALQLGDSGLRSGLSGNAEYVNRAQYRFGV
ncbi:DUF4214 domain-containing protein [Subtercola boreus]|uniref:DUF4214 domain-containing protein n=1 Tax=Subtercola boreus TaxID=120213 RepID=UPI000E2A1883|nr:DUF4214 domain-containing protein [Subtercola boreus]